MRAHAGAVMLRLARASRVAVLWLLLRCLGMATAACAATASACLLAMLSWRHHEAEDRGGIGSTRMERARLVSSAADALRGSWAKSKMCVREAE